MTPEISKLIGWVQRVVPYPHSVQEIRHASAVQICVWHRFLGTPKNKTQEILSAAIYKRFCGE